MQERISQETGRDSSAMKSIAVLTMIFLPSTALAVSCSVTLGSFLPPSSTLLVHISPEPILTQQRHGIDRFFHVFLLRHGPRRLWTPSISQVLDLLGFCDPHYTHCPGNVHALDTEAGD
jgi:hypothetical protein